MQVEGLPPSDHRAIIQGLPARLNNLFVSSSITGHLGRLVYGKGIIDALCTQEGMDHSIRKKLENQMLFLLREVLYEKNKTYARNNNL